MDIKLLRYRREDGGTQGLLYRDGQFWMHTIERPWLNNQRSISCIPTGKYKLGWKEVVTPLTEHYRYRYPDFFHYHVEIKDIQGRSDCYLHVGNSPDDVNGCVAVGRSGSDLFVGHSRDAFKEFYLDVQAALDSGESVTLEISNL